MKKLKILGGFSAAFLAVVTLASCGGGNTPVDKTYHVKFTNGNELVEEKDYKANEVIVAPEDPKPYEKEHKTYTFDAWYDGDVKFEAGVTKATKDVEYVAKFIGEDIQYHVYFKESEDDLEPDVQTLVFGAPIVVPDDLDDYEGDDGYLYEFDGWYDGEDKLEEGDTCIGNQTFIAEFTQGDPVDHTITFTFTGQLDEPVVKTFNCETDPTTFKEPEITTAAGYKVVWTPAYDLELFEDQEVEGSFEARDDIKYTVNHYFPKLDGSDNYLYETEELEGTTDQDTEAEALDVVGFTAQEITQKKVAGDGTTVVDIYYDRDEMVFAKCTDAGETTIETVTDFGANIQKVTLSTNQYGIAWTSLVPNFTKAELEAADGIEFIVKLPYQGNVMCSNDQHFAQNVTGGDFRVIRLTKEAMLSDYHGKKTIDDIYDHMIYPGSAGLGFYFSEHKEETVSIELLSANLYTGELNPLANAVLNSNNDQAKNSAFVNSSNIAKFADAPALPEGATGMVRVLTQPNSWGVSDFRFNPTGLFTKEELLSTTEITLKIYAVPYANEGTMIYSAYLNNVHFQPTNAVGQWIDVKVPTNLIGVQENITDLSSAYDKMVEGHIRVPEFQFKLNGSGYTGGKVAFYFAGVGKVYDKINTLINVKQDTTKTLTYIDSENITADDPELPSGKSAMMKVNVTSDQYGVSNLRLDPTHFFTYSEMASAQTVDLLVYVVKGTAETFTAMLKNTEQFAKGLATNQWVTINIPVQLLLSQGSNPATEQEIVGGWIDFVQFVYDKSAAMTYYVGGVSLSNQVLNADNYTSVSVVDNGEYTSSYITSATKTDADPDFPTNYDGYVKLGITTNEYGLCNIRFNNPLINDFNLKWGHKISFKLYCTGTDIDSTVALSADNNHNHGSKNANEWIDYEWDLTERGTQGSTDRLLPQDVTEWKWISLCRVQFKKGGAALNKGPVTVYLADITFK